jgi:cytochrome c556
MKSWFVMLAVALISVAAATVGAFEDKPADTEAIMKALFKKGAGSKSAILKAQSEAASPDWSAIQKTTKEFAELGSALGKGEPEKGDKASWGKLTGKFAKDTAALDESAQARNLASLQAAQKTIGASCKSCHNTHRGK